MLGCYCYKDVLLDCAANIICWALGEYNIDTPVNIVDKDHRSSADVLCSCTVAQLATCFALIILMMHLEISAVFSCLLSSLECL
jgi:hypothetical protein